MAKAPGPSLSAGLRENSREFPTYNCIRSATRNDNSNNMDLIKGSLADAVNRTAIKSLFRPRMSDEAAAYGLYARGTQAMSEDDFRGAVTLFNCSLSLHRKSLGPDHEACGRTLHQIGICLMEIKDEYAALAAFEEAIYIRQHNYGDGDEGAAAIIGDMWTFLHKKRLDMDGVPDRLDALQRMKKIQQQMQMEQKEKLRREDTCKDGEKEEGAAPSGRPGLVRHDSDKEILLLTKSMRGQMKKTDVRSMSRCLSTEGDKEEDDNDTAATIDIEDNELSIER